MIKIKYPTLPADLKDFEDEFYSLFSKEQELKINNHLNKINFRGSALTFELLVKLKFDELMELRPQIRGYSDRLEKRNKLKNGKTKKSNKFTALFSYEKKQPKLASFFMNSKKLALKTCHYCSIDFINSFKDISDYSSALEFVNTADNFELQYINGIGKAKAGLIISNRQTKKYLSVDDIPVRNSIKKEIKNFDFRYSHNHFTLDHFIPQSSHKFYSLCLYNLIPSCYSCNSKFKNKAFFKFDNDLKYVNPASKDFSLSEDFRFNIFFSKEIEDINSEEDFVISPHFGKNEAHIRTYLSMFKIKGRYIYHKSQLLTLIKKKVMYPDSKIIELSKQTGKSMEEIRKVLFGEELYNLALTNEPFVKFKKDVAKNILLAGVI